MTMISKDPTAYAVICFGDVHPEGYPCHDGKPIYITDEWYIRQLDHPDYPWKCPLCRGNAAFDDDNYEKYMEKGAEV